MFRWSGAGFTNGSTQIDLKVLQTMEQNASTTLHNYSGSESDEIPLRSGRSKHGCDEDEVEKALQSESSETEDNDVSPDQNVDEDLNSESCRKRALPPSASLQRKLLRQSDALPNDDECASKSPCPHCEHSRQEASKDKAMYEESQKLIQQLVNDAMDNEEKSPDDKVLKALLQVKTSRISTLEQTIATVLDVNSMLENERQNNRPVEATSIVSDE